MSLPRHICGQAEIPLPDAVSLLAEEQLSSLKSALHQSHCLLNGVIQQEALQEPQERLRGIVAYPQAILACVVLAWRLAGGERRGFLKAHAAGLQPALG